MNILLLHLSNAHLSAERNLAMSRTGAIVDAVHSKAFELGVSLQPTNQTPYNRHGRYEQWPTF